MKTAYQKSSLFVATVLFTAIGNSEVSAGYMTRQEIAETHSASDSQSDSQSDETSYAPVYKTRQDIVNKRPVLDEESKNLEARMGESMMKRNSVAAPAVTAFSEPQAAEYLKTANEAEIDVAQLAQRRASNEKVKEYAAMIESQHKKNKRDGRKLLGQLDVGTDRSEPASVLKAESSAKIKELKNLRGAAFDQAYMASQIEMHKSLLTDIDQRLIPASEKPELQQFLRDTRGHVKHHLSQAEEIQNSLGTAVR